MSRTVDYYFSLPSPWAYIGHAAFRAVADSHGVTVNHKPVMLGELFADSGGVPLGQRHPARQKYRLVELQRWREKRGLTFHVHPQNWPFNPRLGDGMVIAALNAGLDVDAFLRLAFAAVWEEQRALAEEATLIDLADRGGLPGKELAARAPDAAITAAYEQNRQDALAVGVFGAPAYVLDGEVFWGQDRIELLADALQSGRAPYRS